MDILQNAKDAHEAMSTLNKITSSLSPSQKEFLFTVIKSPGFKQGFDMLKNVYQMYNTNGAAFGNRKFTKIQSRKLNKELKLFNDIAYSAKFGWNPFKAKVVPAPNNKNYNNWCIKSSKREIDRFFESKRTNKNIESWTEFLDIERNTYSVSDRNYETFREYLDGCKPNTGSQFEKIKSEVQEYYITKLSKRYGECYTENDKCKKRKFGNTKKLQSTKHYKDLNLKVRNHLQKRGSRFGNIDDKNDLLNKISNWVRSKYSIYGQPILDSANDWWHKIQNKGSTFDIENLGSRRTSGGWSQTSSPSPLFSNSEDLVNILPSHKRRSSITN
jgi:hypothetical protein